MINQSFDIDSILGNYESLTYSIILLPGDYAALFEFEWTHFMAISTLIKNVGNDKTLEFVLRLLNIKVER